MFILDRRNFLQLTGAAALTGLAAPARAGLTEASVFTADPMGALVDSTVILGDKSAVLVDAQINVANATRLADMIAATGRRLETIFITHFHPDHLLGLDVLMQRFPEARPVTHKAIQPVIAQTAEGMLSYMSGNAPAGTFAKKVVIPEALDADHILLDGERIEVLDPMQGDTALISALHIPALDTLIASDFVFADTFAWTAEIADAATAEAWLASLDMLEGLGAGTVVPGHRVEGSPNDATGIQQTRAYLKQWMAALASSTSRQELEAAMRAGNDGLALDFALATAVSTIYPE